MTAKNKALGFPSIRALTRTLKLRQQALRHYQVSVLRDCEEDNPGVDCRLRIHDGRWRVLMGDSSQDQDHRGLWASGFLPYGRTNLRAIAVQLIEDAE